MTDYAAALEPDAGGTLIRVRVVPGASTTAVAGLNGDRVRLRVSAPPREGRANDRALRHLAGLLGLRPRDLTLVSGAQGRDKVIRVEGTRPAAVAAALAAAG